MSRNAGRKFARHVLNTIVVGVSAIALTACGSTEARTSIEPPVEIPEPTEVVETTGTFEADREYEAEVYMEDGAVATATMGIGKPVDAGVANLPDGFAEAANACSFDSDRDILVPVRLDMVSDEDRFRSQFSTGIIVFTQPLNEEIPKIEIGAAFGNGGTDCDSSNQLTASSGVEFSDVEPGGSASQNFVVVVHDYYSPTWDEGDPSLEEVVIRTNGGTGVSGDTRAVFGQKCISDSKDRYVIPSLLGKSADERVSGCD